MRRKAVVILLFAGMLSIPAQAVEGGYSSIMKRNIFAEQTPAPQRAVTSILKPQAELPLDRILALKGVLYSPSGESKAIIGILSKNIEDLFSEGDIIENAKIVKIGQKTVVFDRGGVATELSLNTSNDGGRTISLANVPVSIPGQSANNPLSKSILKNPGIPAGAVQVPGVIPGADNAPRDINFDDTLDKLKADPGLLGALNVAPYIENGSVNGFTVNNIPAGSLPLQLGLQNGDVVKRVNGVLIDSVAKGYQVYQNVSSTKPALVTVEVIRGGSPLILTYRQK